MKHVVIQTEPCQIVQGDCLVAMRAMPAGTVDAIVTSPPYNIGVKYRSTADTRPRLEYLDWMEQIAVEFRRLLTPDGAVFLNLGSTSTDPWIAHDVSARFRDYLVLQNRISWNKSVYVDGRTHGHFKPVNSDRFLGRTYEEVLHWSLRGDLPIDRLAIGVPYEDKRNLSRWQHATEDKRCAGNTWHIAYETVRSGAGKYHHPAPYPVELARRCLKLHGRPGLVLDPFAGSGTTLVAAQELGWRGIGIEIDPVYAETARQRIAASAERELV